MAEGRQAVVISLQNFLRVWAVTRYANFPQEKVMNSEISAKFAVFAPALTLNSVLIAGVACMFNVSVEQHTAGIGDSSQRQCGCLAGGFPAGGMPP